MIKAIFWDIGGVLILSRRKQVLEDWSKRLSTSPENLRAVIKQFSDERMKGNDLSYNDFIIKNKIDWISAEQLENLQQSLWNSEYVNDKLIKFIQGNKDKYTFCVITKRPKK
ncbi:hypothetical protein M1563_02120 [Patescibacteria group bacterium]|nr:hypothetical protein [Patescibacteria group bacterium]MCL5410090.1 hypothetical protein [Patescibacteria group bacterium]